MKRLWMLCVLMIVGCGRYANSSQAILTQVTDESLVTYVNATKKYFTSRGLLKVERLNEPTFWIGEKEEIEKACRRFVEACNVGHRIALYKHGHINYAVCHELGHSMAKYEFNDWDLDHVRFREWYEEYLFVECK